MQARRTLAAALLFLPEAKSSDQGLNASGIQDTCSHDQAASLCQDSVLHMLTCFTILSP